MSCVVCGVASDFYLTFTSRPYSMLSYLIGGAKLTVERKSKNFIDLSFDRTEVSNSCKGPAEKCLQPLEHFQGACRHIRKVLEHAPQVQTNVSIILNDEETLRKDILKADLPGDTAQAATKAFVENVSKLREIAAGTDTLKRDVEKKFKEFAKASEGFFAEE